MIPTKTFGRTGHESTRTLFGAASLSTVTQDEADKTLEMLLKYGVNHIDTAAGYGDSELRIGPWMKDHRKDFFLATKSDKRTYKEAKEELYRSLDRLKVDSVDLWQMHYLIDAKDWETTFQSGGALEAFVEAKDQGLIRFIGITGHGVSAPSFHLRSLEQYDFDSVLLPYNYIMMLNQNFAAEFEKLVDVCLKRNIAIQTIKSIARGPLGDKVSEHAVWYDPLVDSAAIERAIHWVLGNPNVFLNTVGDIHLLAKVLDAANHFEVKPTDEIMQADIQEFGISPLFSEEGD